MGALDDAIREHLELKRRLGADAEELKRKEDEAFGHARAWQEDAAPLRPAPEAERDVAEAGPPVSPLAEEIEPDEVLPEDSLELEPAPGFAPDSQWKNGDGAAHDGPEVLEPTADLPPALEEVEPDEDMLEQTPDFLEQAPDQDQLWFDKKAPKDFDFDD
jgi:hypothetical protein